MAQPTRQPTSALLYLSLLRSSHEDMDAHTLPGGLCSLHACAAPPHLLPHGSGRCSAALPPSRCSWLRPLSLPSTPSLPLAAAPSDAHHDQPPPPPQMTQVAPDLVGVSEVAAAWLFPIILLYFTSSLHGYLATFG